MAGATVDIGTGATVAFGTSGFAIEIVDIRSNPIERAIIDSSHLGTPAQSAGKFGNRTYIPGRMVDPGGLSFEGHHNPNVQPPIGEVAELITVTFPLVPGDSTAATYSGQGAMTSYQFTIPFEEKMMATVELKFTGPITITAAT
jgi:hypothetical protein